MNSKMLCMVMFLCIGVMMISQNHEASAFNAKTINWKDCSYGKCFSYAPITVEHPKISATTNVSLNAFMPDFTCNITGSILSDGTCSTGPLILSADNYTNFEHDVAAISVENIQSTSSPVNTNYCPLAYYTVTHEDGYFYIIQNVLNLVFPDYCYQELGPVVIPEFAGLVAIAFTVGIISSVIVTARLIRK